MGKTSNEARELARDLLSRARDRLPMTEEDALITVSSNALFGFKVRIISS